MSSIDTDRTPHGATDVIAGLLAASSIVLSVVALAEKPARLVPVAAVLALVAGRMSPRYSRLSLAALFIAVVAWVAGLTIAVITDAPLL